MLGPRRPQGLHETYAMDHAVWELWNEEDEGWCSFCYRRISPSPPPSVQLSHDNMDLNVGEMNLWFCTTCIQDEAFMDAVMTEAVLLADPDYLGDEGDILELNMSVEDTARFYEEFGWDRGVLLGLHKHVYTTIPLLPEHRGQQRPTPLETLAWFRKEVLNAKEGD